MEHLARATDPGEAGGESVAATSERQRNSRDVDETLAAHRDAPRTLVVLLEHAGHLGLGRNPEYVDDALDGIEREVERRTVGVTHDGPDKSEAADSRLLEHSAVECGSEHA